MTTFTLIVTNVVAATAIIGVLSLTMRHAARWGSSVDA